MIWRIIGIVFVAGLVLAEASARLFRMLIDNPGAARWPWYVPWMAASACVLFAMLERRAPVFGRVIWRGSSRQPRVAMTFDDGPSVPHTEAVLDILRRAGVSATFFVLGVNAERHPAIVERAAREGHEIGNHGFDHAVLPLRGPEFTRDQIARTSVTIQRLTGTRPVLFRPSHGWRNPWVNRIAREEGCRVAGWTLGVWDTDRPGADVILRRTLAGVRNGCVLLLHDGRGIEGEPDASQVVQALPLILEGLRARGFDVVTLSRLVSDGEWPPV
jgi:peptidoglycan/xylan/chitin deacetylase (PgdA/CDA1 family)